MHRRKKNFRRTSPMFISSKSVCDNYIHYVTKKRCTVEQRESTQRSVRISEHYWVYIPYLYTVMFPGIRLRICGALYSTRNLFVSRTSSTEVGPLLTAAEKSGCLLELDIRILDIIPKCRPIRREKAIARYSRGIQRAFALFESAETYINVLAMPPRDRRLSTSQ